MGVKTCLNVECCAPCFTGHRTCPTCGYEFFPKHGKRTMTRQEAVSLMMTAAVRKINEYPHSNGHLKSAWAVCFRMTNSCYPSPEDYREAGIVPPVL